MSVTSDSLILSADSAYAKRRKELLALVKQLRAIGAQADLDLPRIAVIGNQSAGKSSLVEAISGITVPRDAGTCTRCPMECRLSSSSGPWTCQLSIRWEYNAQGTRLEETQELRFGDAILDKGEVELALRRAQAAVLNPSIATEKFLALTAEQLSKGSFRVVGDKPALSFSRNVVCVDLSGPDLTDLSFVDLPGIIQNAENDVVALVEDLVRSHIKGNCLILITLPMNDDIENQKAARIAKEEDPSGVRTIGVMTKPDTLLPSATKSRELWLDVIEGRRHPLKHGYFCTRQPDDAERLNGITSAEARTAEARFFSQTSPWSTSTHQGRFGTNSLVETLSKLLTGIIDAVLPQLREEVTQQLNKCVHDIKTYPAPITTEPTSYTLGLVTAFCSEVDAYVKGRPDTATLVQANRRIYEVYKRAIRATAPPFVPYPKAGKESTADLLEYLRLDDEDEAKERDANKSLARKYIYLDDVRQCIRDAVTRELPNNVPYPAKVQLIKDCQTTWEMSSVACFEKVHEQFVHTLTSVVEHKLSRYQNLKTMFSSVLMELVKERRDATETYITSLLRLETTPFTQNEHYFQTTTAKTLAQYKDARAGKSTAEAPGQKPVLAAARKEAPKGRTSQGFSARVPSESESESDSNSQSESKTLNAAIAALAKLGYHVDASDLGKLNPPDMYEEELQVMAEVRAYFQVAYKRVIDYVPLGIDHLFLYEFSSTLQTFLIEKLGLGQSNSAARCMAYLSEDPSVVAIRDELVSKKKRLEAVQKQLFDFGLL